MNRLFNRFGKKYPLLAFYAVAIFTFVLASGAGKKWAR
jgi:hypothetical protein